MAIEGKTVEELNQPLEELDGESLADAILRPTTIYAGGLLAALCDVLGFSVSEIGQLIVTDSEMRNNFEIMVKALEDRQQEKLTTLRRSRLQSRGSREGGC